MGALFRRPKVTQVKAPEPQPVPTIDEAARNRTESDRLRLRRGIRSNFRTGAMGALVPPANVAAKQLTGQ